MDNKPIKRHKALQSLSHEHHHGLLFCWKIREGFKRNIQPERMKKYADWFWQAHLLPHFETEEKYLFTILDKDNSLIKKALAEHRKLNRLFRSERELQKNLSLIEEKLESHIRFEERVLFNEIQIHATAQQLLQLQTIETFHNISFVDDWDDEFWKV